MVTPVYARGVVPLLGWIEQGRSMRLPLALVALASLAACGSSTPPPTEALTTTMGAGTTAESGTRVEAIVDTATSGCDTKLTGTGSCWLPLYPAPDYMGTPLNMSTNLNGSCTNEKPAGCRPQPHSDTLVITCYVIVLGVTWFGVIQEPGEILTPANTKFRTVTGAAIGLAEAQFFRISGYTLPNARCS